MTENQTVRTGSIAQMVEAQIKSSEQFSKENFGLQLGSDFPELARELLQSKHLANKLFAGWMISTLRNDTVVERMTGTSGPIDVVSKSPEIYEIPLSFLYWGIQVGRELQRSQDELQRQLAAQQGS